MSISMETVSQHKNDPAVVCCLTKEGTDIGPSDLEDPSIFGDLEDSGLLELPGNVLKIGQIIGARLKQTVDALTPLTPDLVEGYTDTESDSEKTVSAETGNSNGSINIPTGNGGAGRFDISIGEGRDIKFSITLNGNGGGTTSVLPETAAEPACENKIMRTLTHRGYAVKSVELGEESSFKDGVLVVGQNVIEDILKVQPLVKKISISVIPPDGRHVHTDTIMDVMPVATKVEGKLGEGVTNIIDGVVFVLTGVDEGGAQIHEFGTCAGFMDETIEYGRPGAPDADDYMIRVHIVLQKNTGMERRGPTAAHRACDMVIQPIRDILKKLPEAEATRTEVMEEVRRKGKPRVALVKEVMGQGAMHDNVFFPSEPAGVTGGRHNFDLGNVPVILSPNQVRDGGVHSLCCVGPADKEVTRQYFREPIVKKLYDDEEVDFVGVIFVGSPQANDEKSFVAERLGSWGEALDLDGAIVTTEGFGNNHIDFAGHIEQLGMRGIAVVGVCFSAYQGTMVIGNKYMDAMVETNKDENGMEAQKLNVSVICPEDAERAVVMMKTKMAGIPIEPPERKWNQDVIYENQEVVDKVLRK